MKIKSDNVDIGKVSDDYIVTTGTTRGQTLSLGTYSTLREAVEQALANAATSRVRAALEAIKNKAEELNWNEQALCDAASEDQKRSLCRLFSTTEYSEQFVYDCLATFFNTSDRGILETKAGDASRLCRAGGSTLPPSMRRY